MTKHGMPSKTQMAREERRYRAESLVRDRVMNTPTVKAEVRRIERELARVEKSVKVVKSRR